GGDEPRRTASASAPGLRAARGLAPGAVSGAARDDGAVADLRPLGALLRRPRPPRFHLSRELVGLARRLDHRQDDPRGRRAERGVLVRSPRIVAAASAVDLDFRYGCT